ncbi:hypothetical protein BH20ACT24_BH20ACT24_13240 [soil metagenome]
MRAVDGSCGHRLEAEDDQALFRAFRDHADQDHPEMGLSDDQIRDTITQEAEETDLPSGPS